MKNLDVTHRSAKAPIAFPQVGAFGSSVSVRLSVSGVLRLKLETLYSGQAWIVHAGFGDAMLTGDAATVGAVK